jgi:hypothetical protein
MKLKITKTTTKILICAILIPCLILTACGDKKKSTPKQPEYAVTAPFVEESQRIRLEKPANGWTGEELIKTLYINGNPIPKPYTVEAMGEDVATAWRQ